MRIREAAKAVGVSADTLRFYERSGFLPPPVRTANAYREYSEADIEHLRLLIELRRLEVPLDDAAQVARWCHSGHCGTTAAVLPTLIDVRREEIAGRITALRALDGRLADLAEHLRGRPAPDADGEACCAAAAAIDASAGPCCSPPAVPVGEALIQISPRPR